MINVVKCTRSKKILCDLYDTNKFSMQKVFERIKIHTRNEIYELSSLHDAHRSIMRCDINKLY